MLEKSYYHEDEPSNQNDRNQEDTDDQDDKKWRCKRINNEAEIEVNNLKTSFFLECRELIFLDKIVENDEDKPQRSSWEEIPCEVQYTEHFDSFFSWRIRWFLSCSWCYFWYYLLNYFSGYFFDWRFLWSCFLCYCCCLLRDWRSLFFCCLFGSRFLWSSLFGSTLFCRRYWACRSGGICFYHRWNTKQTLSEVKKNTEKILHFVLCILYFVL